MCHGADVSVLVERCMIRYADRIERHQMSVTLSLGLPHFYLSFAFTIIHIAIGSHFIVYYVQTLVISAAITADYHSL